jgi:hypothetical protein
MGKVVTRFKHPSKPLLAPGKESFEFGAVEN